ncbi:MAG: hypothetical protein WCP22_04340 [Chlamydiota bacterium]
MHFRRASAGWYRGSILGMALLGAAACSVSGCRSSAPPPVIPAIREQTSSTTGVPLTGQERVIKETTIIKEKESHSLLGLMFSKIGDIVALPFKLIALVFDTVF